MLRCRSSWSEQRLIYSLHSFAKEVIPLPTLPCQHEPSVVSQLAPTIELLHNLAEWHPEILQQHGINPTDYKAGLVFRSAIESIRGTYISSSTSGRQGMVDDALAKLQDQKLIAEYEQTSSSSRCDFTITVERDPQYLVGIDVKGGEGNSINISTPPEGAREFGLWSHLDGAIVNPPARGAHSIINRITNEMVQRYKGVDYLFIKDLLCGTPTRPCPKYPGNEDTISLRAAPDVFLFPQRIPTLEDPAPPVHTLETVRLPKLILDLFEVAPADRHKHVWQVNVSVQRLANGKMQRVVRVEHQGHIVDQSAGTWNSTG